MRSSLCRLLPFFVSVLALSVGVGAQRHVLSERADIDGDGFGWAVAGGIDIDVDGFRDFLVGSPWNDQNGKDAGRVLLYSGGEVDRLQVHRGDGAGDWFGAAVAWIGDADGDGSPDFAVGAPQFDVSLGRGYVRVFSGKSGKVITTVRGPSPGYRMGASIAAAGDVDGDGVADIVAGAPFADRGLVDSGRVIVFSARDGREIFSVSGLARDDFLGWSVAGLGDIDGDGKPDVIAGARPLGAKPGYALVLSGKDASLLRRLDGVAARDRLGSCVDGPGDVDRDGTPDVLFASTANGVVRVVSGKDWKVIHAFKHRSVPEFAAHFARGVGDLNGDGYQDVAIGEPDDGNPSSGIVVGRSGRDGSELFRADGGPIGLDFGWTVARAGDVNGDGTPDVLVGEPRGSDRRVVGGSIRVVSGADLGIETEFHSVTAERTTQTLALNAGKANANKLYIIIGSWSGQRPGVPLGGSLRLPLNFDPYLTLTLGLPNQISIEKSVGLLGSEGGATARFVSGLFPVELYGLRLHHAFVVLGNGTWDFVSNAALVKLDLFPR